MRRRKSENYMRKNNKPRASSISKGTSYEEIGEFWDTHDLGDFENETYEVEIETDIKATHCYVSVDPDLMSEVVKAATRKGISSQTFVNLAIRERLAGQRK